ncbi:MAG TPA: GxxExxY protein [Lacipirellulaceae bacterium]|nr:GxxExxY protein [Lacipirellulaceae bacterium]
MAQMGAEGKPGSDDPQTYAIIGACMAVHRELGPGFLESVYQEALAIELASRGVPFVRESTLTVTYAGVKLSTHFRADFICFDEVIVQLKALSGLEAVHHAIILNYLKATGLERGLLVNFGAARLDDKRFIRSHLRPSATSADHPDTEPQT